MTTMLCWFLQCSLMTALVIPVILLLGRLFRRRPAVQHALWIVVALKFVTPTILAWPWPLLNILDSASLVIPGWTDLASTPTEFGFSQFQYAAPNGPSLIVHGWTNPATARVLALITPLLAVVWLLGAAMFAVCQFLRIRKQSDLMRYGTSAPPQLRAVVRDVAAQLGLRPPPTRMLGGIESPFVWCLTRPMLAWPKRVGCEETLAFPRAVIAHELAHLRRHDHWFSWLQLAAGVMWWWNPLFWFVRRKISATAEMACDALALSLYPDDRCAYAESLLNLSVIPNRGLPDLSFGVRVGARSALERRMDLIASEGVHAGVPGAGIIIAALIGVLITPAWSVGSPVRDTPMPTASRNLVLDEVDPAK